ncbi:hypothetical protein AAFF_G00300280 [Aldrovandia affinis]|uniref:Uncharacterized protein n=1 Tax=Aldrovandia affinis TaxID=143900 RepID=A0AAD7WS89_9TELE|nr:hypothetical protein AAFF_G00300280 [Aldrovandia affinis]
MVSRDCAHVTEANLGEVTVSVLSLSLTPLEVGECRPTTTSRGAQSSHTGGAVGTTRTKAVGEAWSGPRDPSELTRAVYRGTAAQVAFEIEGTTRNKLRDQFILCDEVETKAICHRQ